MKKIMSFVFAAMMVLSLAACGGEKADYVISTDKGFSPFEFQDEAGNIVGIDMDILAAIAEDQGFTYDLQYIGWDAAIAACQAGQADGMIAGASITDERKASGWTFSDGYLMQHRVWQLQLTQLLQALKICRVKRLLLRTAQ